MALTGHDGSAALAGGAGAGVGGRRIDERGVGREDQLRADRGAPEFELAGEGKGLAGREGARPAAARRPRARREQQREGAGGLGRARHADHHEPPRRGKKSAPSRAVGDDDRVAASRLDRGRRRRGRGSAAPPPPAGLQQVGERRRGPPRGSSAGTAAPGAAGPFPAGARVAPPAACAAGARAQARPPRRSRSSSRPAAGPRRSRAPRVRRAGGRGSRSGPAPTRRARRAPAAPPGSPARPVRRSRRRSASPAARAAFTTRVRSVPPTRTLPARKRCSDCPALPGKEYSTRPAISSRVTLVAPRPNLRPTLSRGRHHPGAHAQTPPGDPGCCDCGAAGRWIPAQGGLGADQVERAAAAGRHAADPLHLGEHGVEGRHRFGALEPLPGGASRERRGETGSREAAGEPSTSRASTTPVAPEGSRSTGEGEPAVETQAKYAPPLRAPASRSPKTTAPPVPRSAHPRVRDAASMTSRNGRPVFSAIRRQSSYSGA